MEIDATVLYQQLTDFNGDKFSERDHLKIIISTINFEATKSIAKEASEHRLINYYDVSQNLVIIKKEIKEPIRK